MIEKREKTKTNPKGSGRKARFGKKMVFLTKKVPEELKEKLSKIIDIEINQYEILLNSKH